MIRPGSFIWLLAHDMRTRWRAKPHDVNWAVFGMFLFACGMHIPALAVTAGLRNAPLPPIDMLSRVGLFLAIGSGVMLMVAIGPLFLMVYGRRDIDLVLTSPVPFRRVLLVCLLGTATEVAAVALMFAGPFANMMALWGQWQVLLVYPLVLVSVREVCESFESPCAARLMCESMPRTDHRGHHVDDQNPRPS